MGRQLIEAYGDTWLSDMMTIQKPITGVNDEKIETLNSNIPFAVLIVTCLCG
jgi:hypothetical protein